MNAVLPLAIGLVALLYASVGHAGATGYVAVMTLCGIGPDVIRPTALVLNVLVAMIATVQFVRAGHFRGHLFWTLATASVPAASLGGAMQLSTDTFEKLIGIVLAMSALKLVYDAWPVATAASPAADRLSPPRPLVLAALGGGIGLLSGLTGVGGGVFLTPVLLALGAAPVKQIAAATAPFILVNSLAGLAGGIIAGRTLPPLSLPVMIAAVVGGAIGSSIGAFQLPVRALQFLMAAVLAVASTKLLGLL